MPPPSTCSRISTRSTGDNEFHNSKNDSSNSCESSDEESNTQCRYDSVGIVKSLLGPSFEDAVLRTLEFGKSLIQKTDEGFGREKKIQKECKKEGKDNQLNIEMLLKEGRKDQEVKLDCKNYADGRQTRKRIVFTAKLDKDLSLLNKRITSPKKLINVSKIRSLDSDLKQVAQSPEKIKRQLEALIQINKDEPPEHAVWNFPQKHQQFVEMTVMPSLCMYKNDAECTCEPSSYCTARKDQLSQDQCSSERSQRKRFGAPPGICQAPEIISSALGPSLDVAIFDNLKMIRDLFKCESGKGEGTVTGLPHERPRERDSICSINRSEENIQTRLEELIMKVKELEMKEKALLQQIEMEEQERECKRRAFEEEEKRFSDKKAYIEGLLSEEMKKGEFGGRMGLDCDVLEGRHENLRERLLNEEDKLSRLKDQYEHYRREIMEVKNKKECMKRNKSLLDAWDVIASRVCHTRLPSFSRACNLERKQFKAGDSPGNMHCCLLPENLMESPSKALCGKKSRSRSRCGSKSALDICRSKSKESRSSSKCCKSKPDDVPYPIQRDVICGLHQCLKTCSCSSTNATRNDGVTISSDDELIKKYAAYKRSKPACRSRSETETLRRDKCSRIVKVMWAVTRINIFQDNCRTYEVMDATSTPPSCMPGRTEGIFVVKNPQKKLCPTKKRCQAPC